MIGNWFTKSSTNENGRHPAGLSSFRIGDQVRSNRHGSGRVQAINPDGSVIVRFDEQKKSRAIFPSLLERGN